MSTLWTPDGERPIRRESPTGPDPSGDPGRQRPPSAGPDPNDEPTEEELAARLAQMQEQLARTPAEVVIANHAFGLFELAALHLSQQPANLAQARLAIDALGALVEGMTGRLGAHEPRAHRGPRPAPPGVRADRARPRPRPGRRTEDRPPRAPAPPSARGDGGRLPTTQLAGDDLDPYRRPRGDGPRAVGDLGAVERVAPAVVAQHHPETDRARRSPRRCPEHLSARSWRWAAR